jgi:cytochrome c
MMNKFNVLTVVLIFLVSCTSNTAIKEKQKAISISKNEKGLNLINANDCVACHKVDEKLTGPSYKEIAEKYPNTPENASMLAQKIIKGGQGVWGAMVMLPHPKISEEDALQMAEYILGLIK